MFVLVYHEHAILLEPVPGNFVLVKQEQVIPLLIGCVPSHIGELICVTESLSFGYRIQTWRKHTILLCVSNHPTLKE